MFFFLADTTKEPLFTKRLEALELRRLSKIISCAITAFFLNDAYAQVFITPRADVTDYTSASVDLMNKRLGNSNLLPQASQFGRAISYGFQLGYTPPPYRWYYTLSYFQTKEAFSSSNAAKTSIEADYFIRSALFGAGIRIYPLEERKLVRSKKPKDRYKNRLFLDLHGKFGGMMTSHNFSLQSPNDNTKVIYATTSIHHIYGAELNAKYLLTENFDFSTYAGYYFTGRAASTHSLNSFVVRGEDLRYKAKDLQLKKLTDSPLQIWQVGAGITLNF